jgi:hypothetical protein
LNNGYFTEDEALEALNNGTAYINGKILSINKPAAGWTK